jgi:hypothetical protein
MNDCAGRAAHDLTLIVTISDVYPSPEAPCNVRIEGRFKQV